MVTKVAGRDFASGASQAGAFSLRVCSSSGQESKTPVHKNGPHQAGGVGFPLKGPLDKGHGLQNQTKKESLVSGTRRSWPVQVH